MARPIETTYRELNRSKVAARQLAIEIRSQRFAFAVLHGSKLLDSGIRNLPRGISGMKRGISRLMFLLQLYAPSVVVARRTRQVRGEPAERAARVFRRIRQELTRRSIPFIPLDRNDIRKVFGALGCRTKHEIAAAVAERFQELKPRVPRPRKPWDPERKRSAIFDAIATAIAFNELRESGDV